MYAETIGQKSLQLIRWPAPDEEKIDEDAEKEGDLVMAVITAIRQEKAEMRKPLNAQIKRLKIYAGNSTSAKIISENKEDIIGTCKITLLEILSEKAKGRGRQVLEIPEMSFTSEY
jgi:valyl-tRNA synthetase